MNTNCNPLDPHKRITTNNLCAHECLAAVERQPAPREPSSKEEKFANNDAATRAKNLERAIVIGSVLILILVAVVFYLKFAALGNATDGYSNLGIQMITHY